MSTSFLYHGFGLVGYNYVRTQYVGVKIIFTIERKREKICCSFCGSRNVVFRHHQAISDYASGT